MKKKRRTSDPVQLLADLADHNSMWAEDVARRPELLAGEDRKSTRRQRPLRTRLRAA